jgi:hypothetical protein
VYLDHVGVAKVPDDYEDRLTEMFPGVYKNLRISKLQRNIQRDRDDVKHLARSFPLEIETLKQRYEKELRWQGIPEREDLTLKMWIEMIEESKGSRTP